MANIGRAEACIARADEDEVLQVDTPIKMTEVETLDERISAYMVMAITKEPQTAANGPVTPSPLKVQRSPRDGDSRRTEMRMRV